jgi:hypothetical protein
MESIHERRTKLYSTSEQSQDYHIPPLDVKAVMDAMLRDDIKNRTTDFLPELKRDLDRVPTFHWDPAEYLPAPNWRAFLYTRTKRIYYNIKGALCQAFFEASLNYHTYKTIAAVSETPWRDSFAYIRRNFAYLRRNARRLIP